MVTVFFWTEEGEAKSVHLSIQTNRLLAARARTLRKRTQDVLREIFEFFGQITETDLVRYLDMQLTKPS